MAKSASLSIIVPAYNEEKNIIACASSIANVLDTASIDYELILVDNGSTDKTGEKIGLLEKSNKRVRKVSVKKNIGYGYGVRKGLEAADGKYAGWIDADNQVDANFVVDMYRKIDGGNFDLVIAKRIYRHDGAMRRIASFFYNSLVFLLFFINMRDINAKPKIFRKDAYETMKISSNDWFIDTELLLKFKAGKYSVATMDCVSKERAHGKSNVRPSTVFEFLKNILAFRMGMR